MTGTLDRTHVVFAVVAASTLLVARLARLGKRDFLALAGLWALTAAILRVIGPLASLGEYDDYALYLGATGQSVGSPIRPFYDWLLAGNPDILLAFPVHAVTAAFLPSLAYLVARRAGALPRVGIHAGLLVAASASTLVYGAGLNEFVPFAVAVGLTALLVDGATEETSLFGLATRCVAAFAAGIWTLAAATLRAEGYFLLVLVPIALFSETRFDMFPNIPTCKELVERIVSEAETMIRGRLAKAIAA